MPVFSLNHVKNRRQEFLERALPLINRHSNREIAYSRIKRVDHVFNVAFPLGILGAVF